MKFRYILCFAIFLFFSYTIYVNYRYYILVNYIGNSCSFMANFVPLGTVRENYFSKKGLVEPKENLSSIKHQKDDLCIYLSNSYQIIIPFVFFNNPQVGITIDNNGDYSYIEIGVGGSISEIDGLPVYILGSGKIYNIYLSGMFSRYPH